MAIGIVHIGKEANRREERFYPGLMGVWRFGFHAPGADALCYQELGARS